MTIDFLCPGCQAQIRVDKRAGGKKGNCPHCRLKLVIPARSGEPAVPVEASPDSAEFPVYFQPAEEPPAEQELPDPLGSDTLRGVPTRGPTTDPLFQVFTPPTSGATLRRKPRRKKPPVIPIFFGLILIGTIAWMVLNFGSKLTGELKGEVVEPSVLQNGLIGATETGADRATFEQVREDLANEPLVLLDIDELFKVFVQGTSSGLEVSIAPTERGKCVRVRPRDDGELAEYVSDQAKLFNEQRVANLKQHGQRFVKEWAATIGQPKREIADLGEIRNHMALASTVSGFGYHVAAYDGSKAYPCVSVGSGGELYFIVPAGLKSFQLLGRSVGEGLESFPGEYTVLLQNEAKSPPPTQPAETPTEPMPDGETLPSDPAKADPKMQEAADSNLAVP